MASHSDVELAYLAGIVDGEGHVGFRRGRTEIVVCMADTQILHWCHERFGGSLSSRWRLEGSNSRPRRMWHVSAREDLSELIPALLPFVVLKGEELRILLAAIEHRGRRPTLNHPTRAAWRESYYEFDRKLKTARSQRKLAAQ